MAYVDGFVIPIPKKNIAAYKKIARAACKVWMELGAVEYREAIGEDLAAGFGMPFPRLCSCKKNETVVFSWIVYKSKAHRDAVNAKVMRDPRIAKMMNPKKPPFDMKRLAYGGFDIVVSS